MGPGVRRDDVNQRSRGARRPSFAFILRPEERGRRESRVRAAPAVSCAKICTEVRTRAYRSSGEHPAFPAQWFYGLFRALPGEPSSLATVISEISSANLAPASGARTTRLHRPLEPRSSVVTLASTASHRAFVTTRDPPLSSGETVRIWTDLPFLKIRIFSSKGLYRLWLICPSGSHIARHIPYRHCEERSCPPKPAFGRRRMRRSNPAFLC
jgi:hypothetical protein